MNKGDLVKAIAEKTALSQNQSKAALEAALDIIFNTVKSGDAVTILGFGTFRGKEFAERIARNPQTNETITVPACKRFVFKAAGDGKL